MEFLQDEHPKQGVHLVACRACIAIVSLEAEVGQWKYEDELLNRIMVGMRKPGF